jgi:ribosomal protein S26
MRRGCISLGEIKCDGCEKPIPYPDRYLAIDEKDGAEDDEGETKRYCVDCAIKKGYAHYKDEKGERVLTFF